MANAARLKVLKAQDDHVAVVLDEAKKRLADVTKDKTEYQRILVALVTQGLLQLLETNVTIRCREEDVSLVQAVLPVAAAQFKENTGKDCNLKIDESSFLNASL